MKRKSIILFLLTAFISLSCPGEPLKRMQEKNKYEFVKVEPRFVYHSESISKSEDDAWPNGGPGSYYNLPINVPFVRTYDEPFSYNSGIILALKRIHDTEKNCVIYMIVQEKVKDSLGQYDRDSSVFSDATIVKYHPMLSDGRTDETIDILGDLYLFDPNKIYIEHQLLMNISIHPGPDGRYWSGPENMEYLRINLSEDISKDDTAFTSVLHFKAAPLAYTDRDLDPKVVNKVYIYHLLLTEKSTEEFSKYLAKHYNDAEPFKLILDQTDDGANFLGNSQTEDLWRKMYQMFLSPDAIKF